MNFQCEGDFDHSPAILIVFPSQKGGKKHLRYLTMWRGATQYLQIVRHNWSIPVMGYKLFRVLTSLKDVKQVLKTLNKDGFFVL